MRWGVFVLFTFAALVLEMTILPLAEVGGVWPLATPIVAMFVSLWAPRMTALWACLLLGALVDLTSPVAAGEGRVIVLLGPHALGFSFACALVLQIRALMLRRQVLAPAAVAMVFVAASSVVVVAILTARSWFTPELAELAPTRDLVRRLGVALATGILALPAAWFLNTTASWWRFEQNAPARTSWR